MVGAMEPRGQVGTPTGTGGRGVISVPSEAPATGRVLLANGGAARREEELPQRYFVVLHESYGPYGAGIVYRHSFYTEQDARAYVRSLTTYFENLGLGKWRKSKRVVDKFNEEADITEIYALDAWCGRDLDGPAKIILAEVVDERTEKVER